MSGTLRMSAVTTDTKQRGVFEMSAFDPYELEFEL